MKRVPILPTLVTLGNAFCGFTAITYILRAQASPEMFGQNIRWAGWLILAAMVFDALDGKVARLARATSDFGAELDSLCDIVSFGVAPALIVTVLAAEQQYLPRFGWAAAVFYVMCTALRLARFNVETDESEEAHQYFKGLPSPAAAGFIAAMAISIYKLREEAEAPHEFAGVARALAPYLDSLLYVIPYVALTLGILMICNVRYIHVMNRMLRGQEPLDYLVKLMLVIVLIVLTQPFSLPLLVGVYIASGLVNWAKEQVVTRLPEPMKDRGNGE
jgi:CDP-diacylglycerol--serine O-phosphatidyltransferase